MRKPGRQWIRCGPSLDPHTYGDQQTSTDNGRATPERVIVVAAFAVLVVSMSWVDAAVVLRVAGIVHVIDVLSDLLGPVVPCGHWAIFGGRKNESRWFTHRHRRRMRVDGSA